jgi:hypothetical protein
VDIDRRGALVAAWLQAEDHRSSVLVDRFHDVVAREIHGERDPVRPADLEQLELGVVLRGDERRQRRLVEPLGEAPFGLVWIHRCA